MVDSRLFKYIFLKEERKFDLSACQAASKKKKYFTKRKLNTRLCKQKKKKYFCFFLYIFPKILDISNLDFLTFTVLLQVIDKAWLWRRNISLLFFGKLINFQNFNFSKSKLSLTLTLKQPDLNSSRHCVTSMQRSTSQ